MSMRQHCLPRHATLVGAALLLAIAALPAAADSVSIDTLLAEARAHNPEIAAARAAGDAARQRIAPAGALEDPMLEVGIVNAPLPFDVRREDMTMKMLGLSQRLPFPGKRALRRAAADAEATSIGHARDETVDRVLRDVRASYEALRFTTVSQRLVGDTLAALQQLAALAEARYGTGGATQGDVLQAQIQVARMQQEGLRLAEARAQGEAGLRRLLGRHGAEAGATGADTTSALPFEPEPGALLPLRAERAELLRAAHESRPQAQALAALIDKSERDLALARREYYPDFDLRVSYGQRGRTPEGMPRDDLITLTVAVNLPLWRSQRQAPRVAEALALRAQATSMAEQQQLETAAALEGALATEHRQRENARLLHSTLLPQSQAAFDSALAGYRVGSVDFATLLEARMRVYETGIGEAEALATHNQAIADIDFLTGQQP